MKKLLILVLVSLFYSSFSINLLADDYIISEDSEITNDDNTIDGSDSLTLNSRVTIEPPRGHEGIDPSGNSNTIIQLGNISTSGSASYENAFKFWNKKSIIKGL